MASPALDARDEYAALTDTAFAFSRSQCLFTAVQLDLCTRLDGKALEAEEIRACVGIDPRGSRNLLDALVGLGILRRERGRYCNTSAASRYLVEGGDLYIGDYIKFIAARLYPVWRQLPEAIRTGLPQNEARTEPDYYANLGADTIRHDVFLKAMGGLSARPAAEIAQRFPWDRYRSFVDLGGALGAVAVHLVKTHPHLEGGVFDLPSVRPFFETARADVLHRIRFHDGDFFETALPATDVFILGHVLHNWNDEEKAEILSRACAALAPGGAVIVYECLLDDHRRGLLALIDALNMLLVTRTGGGISVAECHSLLKGAGFLRSETLLAEEPVTVVVGWKA